MVGPFEPVESFDMDGRFDMVGPFKRVETFDMVGQFEPL